MAKSESGALTLCTIQQRGLALALAGAALVAWWWRERRERRERRHVRFAEVPGSAVAELGDNQCNIMEKLEEWAESYGSEGFFEMKLGSRVVVCYTWEQAQQILALRPWKMIQNSSMSKAKDILAGLVFSEGRQWQRERKLLAPAFNVKNTESYLPAVESVTGQLLKELSQEMSQQGFADFSELLVLFGADVMCKTCMGKELKALETRKATILDDVKVLGFAIRKRINSWIPYWKLPFLRLDGGAAAAKRVHERCQQLIAEADPSQKTIARKMQEMVDGDKFTQKEFLDHLTTIFLGGADTTSRVLCWVFYYLARDPKLQEHVAQEVRDLPEALSAKDLDTLLWVQAVWKETLRYHSASVYMPLEAHEPATLAGRVVPEGTAVWIAIRHILRNDPAMKCMGDNLREYRPSRWLSSGLIQHEPLDALAYGHGSRICIGMPLANYTGLVVMARVVQHFVLEWRGETVPEVSYGLTGNLQAGPVAIHLRPRGPEVCNEVRPRTAVSLMDLGPDALVEIYDFPTGRGFRALQPLQKGQVYLKVPLEKCWSAVRARQDYKELQTLSLATDEDVMALHLLLEKARGESGWNAEHLRCLPKSFDMLPHWSEDELGLLQEPELESTARRLKKQVQSDFSEVLREAKGDCLSLLEAAGGCIRMEYAKFCRWFYFEWIFGSFMHGGFG
ncbi:unnamed protein product, partial [Effrenium voratum]